MRHSQSALSESFDALALDLRAATDGKPFVFVVNHGNWGDALIREGSEAFFRHYRFEYTSVTSKNLIKNRVSPEEIKAKTGNADAVMVYSGCGAFTHHYGRVEEIAHLSSQFSSSFFLPSTYAVNVAEYDFAPNCTFYSRDHSESMENAPGAKFCHDMAFFYSAPAFAPPRFENGLFLRDDPESPAGMVIPKGYGNLDLSQRGTSDDPIFKFMKHLAKYETIYTNRLHIAIGGALLGREVHLYPNDYFKIRAIYQASLAPYFPKVHFHQEFDLGATPFRKKNFLQRLFS